METAESIHFRSNWRLLWSFVFQKINFHSDEGHFLMFKIIYWVNTAGYRKSSCGSGLNEADDKIRWRLIKSAYRFLSTRSFCIDKNPQTKINVHEFLKRNLIFSLPWFLNLRKSHQKLNFEKNSLLREFAKKCLCKKKVLNRKTSWQLQKWQIE